MPPTTQRPVRLLRDVATVSQLRQDRFGRPDQFAVDDILEEARVTPIERR
jgi:hypothetical protein